MHSKSLPSLVPGTIEANRDSGVAQSLGFQVVFSVVEQNIALDETLINARPRVNERDRVIRDLVLVNPVQRELLKSNRLRGREDDLMAFFDQTLDECDRTREWFRFLEDLLRSALERIFVDILPKREERFESPGRDLLDLVHRVVFSVMASHRFDPSAKHVININLEYQIPSLEW